MKVWAKKREIEAGRLGVARAALAGATNDELVQEALSSLTQYDSAVRVGVWLVPHSPAQFLGAFSILLHGLVRDRANPDSPKEWRTLSLEPPLPDELLLAQKAVHQDLSALPANLLIGPLLGLRHALWVPVAGREQIRGLILIGGKVPVPAFVREHALAVAAELALALELRQHQFAASTRSADLLLARRLLDTSSAQSSADVFLSRLVAECVEDAGSPGPRAVFAVIGVLSQDAANAGQLSQVDFRWRSGDASWARAVEGEPLSKVWRRALEARQVIGSDPPSAWASAAIARIVAYPLESRGGLLGVLVVGLPAATASLATLDRLELRALFAASALERKLGLERESARSEEIRQIYQEAERAGAILRQLLLNARETVPERRLVSLNQIVMRALELQRFSLAAEKIRVEMDLDPALPFVHGDPGQLQQVLMNLVGNAQQALEQMGQGGIIRMRTRRVAERRVLLEVEDNGPGIPPAIQARIFDPFFTTKPAGVGTGLGLSIVLSVVREHGGQVRVQSPPQGGATFQVELPAASERQQAESRGPVVVGRKTAPLPPPAFSADAEPRSPAFESRKGANVLVVEDEPTVARLIADVLEDEGMRVTVLLDGREALECAKRESYDLVICDMKMPGLDGQHFYKSLERDGNQLRERFLFVTGDILGAQTREFLERHGLPHVAKPFRVEELTERVHAVLRMHNLHEPSAAADSSRKNAARNG